MFSINKDPDAILWYGIDWTAWLTPGDSVSNAIWILDSELTEEASIVAANVAKIKLAGGTLGSAAKATCRITTAITSEVDDRTITLNIVER